MHGLSWTRRSVGVEEQRLRMSIDVRVLFSESLSAVCICVWHHLVSIAAAYASPLIARSHIRVHAHRRQ
eukprot:3402-Eustigmatos_ZCMA.PRE.1